MKRLTFMFMVIFLVFGISSTALAAMIIRPQHGTNGNDYLSATDNGNKLLGGDGDDVLIGRLGDDVLIGGNGNDSIWDDAGSDVVKGGEGHDVLVYMFRENVDGAALKDVYDFFNGNDGYDTLTIDLMGVANADAIRHAFAYGFNLYMSSGTGRWYELSRAAREWCLTQGVDWPDGIHLYIMNIEQLNFIMTD